jgi:hypothetical protein
VREGKEGEVDVRHISRFVASERAKRPRELGMDVAEHTALFGVGAEVDEIEVVVGVDEAYQLSARVPGSAEHGNSMSQPPTS